MVIAQNGDARGGGFLVHSNVLSITQTLPHLLSNLAKSL